jgi:cytochrome c556
LALGTTRHCLDLLQVLLLAALAGCAMETAPRDDNLHALMTDTLNVQMARLNALSFELHQTQTELDRERQRRRNEIATAAGRLREAAGAIADAALPASLQDEDRQLFETLAVALQGHASSLEQSARDGDFGRLETQMAELNATCNTCHNLYRPRR